MKSENIDALKKEAEDLWQVYLNLFTEFSNKNYGLAEKKMNELGDRIRNLSIITDRIRLGK